MLDYPDMYPSGWSLCPLDAGLRPEVDPKPLMRRAVPLPDPPPAGVGVVTGPVSGVWAGPVEGSPGAVSTPTGAWGLWSARGRGRGWAKAGTVIPVHGPGVVWLHGSAERLAISALGRAIQGAQVGDPRAVADLAEAVGVPASEVDPTIGWSPARWPVVPPPIPWELAPPRLSEISYGLARAHGYSQSGTGLACAGFAAAALMGRSEVVMTAQDGGEVWRERNPALYTMLVASSSAGKSPIFQELLPPIQRRQVEEQRRGARELAEDQVARALAEGVMRRAANQDEMEEAAEILGRPEVVQTSLITDNATPAKLADTVARQVGLLYVNPDASNFFEQCVSDKRADIKALLNAYSGDPAQPTLRIGRRGAPAAGAPLRMAVIAATQPEVLYRIGRTDSFSDQGLLARICWAVWDGPTGEGGRSFSRALRAEWARLMDDLWGIECVRRDAEGVESGALRSMVVGPAGTAELLALRRRLRARTAPGRDLFFLASWCGKAHGQAARIANMFALIEDPKTTRIADKWVEAAIEIVEHGLLPHAVAAWTRTRWPPETQTAIHLWSSMRAHGVTTWTRARIAEYQGAVDLDPADVTAALRALVDRGFLRETARGVWVANPLAEDPEGLT